MIKGIVFREIGWYVLASLLGGVLIYYPQINLIGDHITIDSNTGASNLYSTLVAFFGGNLGFVIASLTIVFGIMDKRSFDGLFKNNQVKKLYVLFFSIIISSALNAVFNFFAMVFAPSNKSVLQFSILFLSVWLLQFSYFVRVFFAVVKVSVDDRRNTIAQEQKDRVRQRKEEGMSLVKDEDRGRE